MQIVKKIARLARYGFPRLRPKRPQLVIFHITTRCDMACRHCADDVWGDPKNDLSLEEIARFSAGLGRIEALALGGGEPFLRPDLVRICRLFVENNKVSGISIPSNGFASERIGDRVLQILTECPELALNVMLSLDGFAETHDAIRTPGSFARVLETARRLEGLSARFPRLSLSFNATINNLNRQELPSLAQFVADQFQARLEFNVISGSPRDPGLSAPASPELEETLKALMELSPASALKRLYHEVYREILLQANAGKGQAVPCRAGSLVCLVDANGDLRACPVLPPLGNLRQGSFEEIWHGERAREQFRAICRGACACNNDCFIRLSLMNYWKLPLLMLGKWAGRGPS